jgi:saccharopine dehydrogenase-like NADP-dependent oxidoreductase
VKVSELMEAADMVVDALPPSFALGLAKKASEIGVHLVSSMYYLDPLEKDPEVLAELKTELNNIHEEATSKNVTILPEFGLDPGIDLVLGAKALSEFDEVEIFNSYGTGIPVEENADNPLKYRFSWSISGLLRAYRRPSRIISKGEVVEIDGKEIFSPENRHLLYIDEIATNLECYPNGNSAYYTELFGLKGKVEEMGRYASRYPGHCDFWYIMANSGFLDDEPIAVGDTNISPIDFVERLLGTQKQFQFGPGEADLAMVRVEVTGKSTGKRKKVAYQLIDYKDVTTGLTAMQRTVGFTMALGARMILNGQLNQPGLISPIDVPYFLLEAGLKEFDMDIKRFEIPVDE